MITISVSKYNEVNPTELKRLFELGARIKKSEFPNGVFIGQYKQGDKMIKAYTDDDIVINNVTLPLSKGATYDCTLTIN